MAFSGTLPALLVLSYAAVSAACPPFNSSHLGVHNEKRWFAIRDRADIDELASLWPYWPPGQDDITTIRYCFETQAAYTALNDWVVAGIQLWEPAYAVSRVVVQPYDPDVPVCSQNPQLPPDILHIDITADNTCVANRAGYVPDTSNHVLGNGIRCNPTFAQPQDMPQYLAHEFGHAFGLKHEHQRPDAENFVEWRCHNHQDYAEWKQIIAEQRVPPYEPGDTIEGVCTDYRVAGHYTSSPFVPYPDWRPGLPGSFAKSTSLDYTSIMIYESFAGTHNTQNLDQATLVGFDPANPEKTWQIWPGREQQDPVNHEGPWSAVRVSQSDIEGVKWLYPRKP